MPSCRVKLTLGLLFAATLAAPALVHAGRLTDHDKAAFTGKLKARSLETRLESVKQLADIPDPESARLLIRYGLHDVDQGVRQTAYNSLLKFKEDRSVCDFFVEQLNAEAKRARPDPTTPLLLGVLLSSDLADVQTATMRYVNEGLSQAKDGVSFAINLADMLSTRHDAEDLVPLVRLAGTKAADKFGARRAIVGAIVQIDDVKAIEALMTMLPKLDGEVRADVVEYLALLTKQQMSDTDDWLKWWNEHKENFKFPVGFQRPEKRIFQNLVYGAEPTYYRLPLYAKRMVFVLDASGSMTGERIEAAKRELIKSIQELKETIYFTILVYNDDVFFWRRVLVEATTANRNEAMQFVSRIMPQNQTCTFDALQAAFYFDAEAIYLLTDGAPTSGRIVAQPEIIKAITMQNRRRRESIYTIGIDTGEIGGDFDEFLRVLAESNFGLYQRVDE